MAGVKRFELLPTGLEPDMLPLHQTPIYHLRSIHIKLRDLPMGIEPILQVRWRSGRDSNPRSGETPTNGLLQ